MLRAAGFEVIQQTPVTIINRAYHEDAFAYWVARLMADFCVTRNLISQEDANAWLMSLSEAQEADNFFFSSTPVVTVAVAVTT